MPAQAPDPRPTLPTSIALFLDVDGTLLEIAPVPQAVSVSAGLRSLLHALQLSLGGALALVSGRSIADLERLFAPLRLPMAGLHGFERRDAAGICRRNPAPAAATLRCAREVMSQLAARHPGLLVEDKEFALALHYRRAPQLEAVVLESMLALAARLQGDLELQRGKMVLELRPAGATKAAAVSAFLAQPPFAGRVPVYLGDDLTDESAFELVTATGGLSVLVGPARASAATVGLPGVTAAHEWLALLASDPTAALERLSAATALEERRLRSAFP
jgi:trehalose 6-phosphate phosphatase